MNISQRRGRPARKKKAPFQRERKGGGGKEPDTGSWGHRCTGATWPRPSRRGQKQQCHTRRRNKKAPKLALDGPRGDGPNIFASVRGPSWGMGLVDLLRKGTDTEKIQKPEIEFHGNEGDLFQGRMRSACAESAKTSSHDRKKMCRQAFRIFQDGAAQCASRGKAELHGGSRIPKPGEAKATKRINSRDRTKRARRKFLY